MTATEQTHPVIVYTLERKIIGASLQHTLVLTDPDFYEALDECDWAGSDFQSGVEESDNGSLPDGPGLWTAEFRTTDLLKPAEELIDYQLVQESPWRPLNDEEAWRFAQGLPIEEVIVARSAPPDTTVCVAYMYRCEKCGTFAHRPSPKEPPIDYTVAPNAECAGCGCPMTHIGTHGGGVFWEPFPSFPNVVHPEETTDE